LLCVGDLNVDITITAPDGIALGSDTAGRVALCGGGSAANVSAWAVRNGLASRFAGVVGDDRLGDFLVDDLAASGVEVRPIRRVDESSRSVAAIIGADGDRSMISDLSSATALVLGDVDPTWFDGVTWLHLTGYTSFQPGGAEVVAKLIELASDRGVSWSIDPSSSQMLTTSSESIRAAWAGASVMFPNRDEAEVLTGEKDPSAGAECLLDTAETVVVTCGANGAVVARRGCATFSVPSEPSSPTSNVVVNALGCGDAFAAGFIAGRCSGIDDQAAVSLASASAVRALALPSSR
jgi:sugar/nucleoside kinase (ribokinase family)